MGCFRLTSWMLAGDARGEDERRSNGGDALSVIATFKLA